MQVYSFPHIFIISIIACSKDIKGTKTLKVWNLRETIKKIKHSVQLDRICDFFKWYALMWLCGDKHGVKTFASCSWGLSFKSRQGLIHFVLTKLPDSP